MNDPTPTHRRTYFVRLWLESDGETVQWRGLIESIPPGLNLYFASLADLNDFFRFQTDQLIEIKTTHALIGVNHET